MTEFGCALYVHFFFFVLFWDWDVFGEFLLVPPTWFALGCLTCLPPPQMVQGGQRWRENASAIHPATHPGKASGCFKRIQCVCFKSVSMSFLCPLSAEGGLISAVFPVFPISCNLCNFVHFFLFFSLEEILILSSQFFPCVLFFHEREKRCNGFRPFYNWFTMQSVFASVCIQFWQRVGKISQFWQYLCVSFSSAGNNFYLII